MRRWRESLGSTSWGVRRQTAGPIHCHRTRGWLASSGRSANDTQDWQHDHRVWGGVGVAHKLWEIVYNTDDWQHDQRVSGGMRRGGGGLKTGRSVNNTQDWQHDHRVYGYLILIYIRIN